jgi:DNA modification methylase
MAQAFLNKLKILNVEIRVESDKLKWKALQGVMTDSLKGQLKIHKAELLTLLRDKKADAYHQNCDSTSSKKEQQFDSESENTDKKIPLNTIMLGDCLDKLKTIPDNSIDLIVTDPPFGIGFMGKAWDTFKPGYVHQRMVKDNRRVQTVRKEPGHYYAANPADIAGSYDRSPKANRAFGEFINKVSTESLRVLKPGAFMFMFMTPRQDSLSRSIVGIEDAGFKIGFTPMFWTYATGFPKANNIGKKHGKFEGAYGGFQPKPAVEAIIVAQKPPTEKTQVGQALKNGKGVTWMDDCRIPYTDDSEKPPEFVYYPDMRGDNYGQGKKEYTNKIEYKTNQKGRFPANLLVSDEIINDGRENLGVYSRFFSLDAWTDLNLQYLPKKVQRNLPFLIVPKAPKKEKDAGCEKLPVKPKDTRTDTAKGSMTKKGLQPSRNNHPTVKPIKLMAYLITMGSRENDIVLDPFAGSGTTCIAAKMLNRQFIGIEISPEYHEIAIRRLENVDEDNTIKKSMHKEFKVTEFKVTEEFDSEKIKIAK